MPPRPARRRLTGEETALWSHVAAGFRPLGGHRAQQPAEVPEPAAPQRDTVAPDRPPPNAPVGKVAAPPRMKAPLSPAPRIDARLAARLARGKLVPEARLDLHGMTLAEAQPALIDFIARSRSAGRRLILVITGKGSPTGHDDGPMPPGRGVLRRQVPHWLQQAPLSPHVIETRAAHRRHGGDGALYVWLRRPGASGLQRPDRDR